MLAASLTDRETQLWPLVSSGKCLTCKKNCFSDHVFLYLPSVLWCCWLGGRKGIRPVKKQSGGVLLWLSVWSKVHTCIWLSWCHCHSLSLASVKSRLVLPFWYRLTWLVPEKGPLNVCVCVLLIIWSLSIPSQFGVLEEFSNFSRCIFCRWCGHEGSDIGRRIWN